MTKVCTKCKRELPVEMFRKKSVSRDGLQSWCKDCHLVADRARRKTAKRRESRKEHDRTYRQKHPEVRRATKQHWRDENRDKERAWVRVASVSCRAQRKAAEGSHTVQAIQELYEEQDGKCYYCGADISGGYHVDHHVPLSKGGTNYRENLRLACSHCNLTKGAKLPEAFSPNPVSIRSTRV